MGQAVVLGRLDDAGHRLDGDDRVGAHAGLARQHHGVGAVEHGVRDVGGLGPGRPGVLDHRLEHLGGHDHRLGAAAGLVDDQLLVDRHVLERALHAEVAARDHDPVEGLDDAVDRLERLRLLDLGDDRDRAGPPRPSPCGRRRRRTALRTKLSAMKSTPIRSAQRRSSTSFSDSAGTETATPGRLMPLLSLTLPPTITVVWTSCPSTESTFSRTLPSSMRIGSPAPTSSGRPLYVVPHCFCVTRHVARGDGPLLALLELDRAVGEPLEPDLRALEVGEDPDAVPALVGGLAHEPVVVLVVGVAAVAHVEPGDVHAGVDELADLLGSPDRWAEGADDLGSTHPSTLANLGSIQVA